MGTAIQKCVGIQYKIIGLNSSNINIENHYDVQAIINLHKPDILINTIAMLGLDNCEKNPIQALHINTLLPRYLAELSVKYNFLLIHFSTDSVFNNKKQAAYNENDLPSPLNIYGATKYSADCLIQAIAKRYYILRIAMIFGPTTRLNQFAEKMIDNMKKGETIRIAQDVVTTPSYSIDIATCMLELCQKEDHPSGVYHVANSGSVSLYQLMKKLAENLHLQKYLEIGSHSDFNGYAIKNTCTPLESIKLNPMRAWNIALEEYCHEYLITSI